uniref:Chemosensory protein 11 n=1 Tax=Ectropis obliqua TaxID=248899 RepID=A0A1L2BL83_ECTOB|nr:chemosensory protein 11 [Ectropis obliqua]
MRSSMLLCAVALWAFVSGDDVLSDEDELLIEDEKWFQGFHDCLMKTGPCPEEIKKYTNIIPIYLKTACGPCSPKEKEIFQKHKQLVAAIYPKMFADLKAKFVTNTTKATENL